MKKILLLVLVVGIGFSAMSQAYNFKIDTKEQTRIEAPAIGIEPVKSAALTKSDIQSEVVVSTDRDVDVVNIINIGTSANAYGYGYAGGQKSLVWVEPGLNLVTNFHRMGGDLDVGGYSGDLGYDISLDGGASWTNQIECYEAIDNGGGEYFIDAARYPNHGIYNPTDNVEDAYLAFFAPLLDGSNSGWGGYGRGTSKITDPSVTTRNIVTSEGDYFRYIPDSYELTTQGDVWVVDANQDWSSESLDYQGDLIVSHGVWDGSDYVYSEYLMEADAADDLGRPTFIQVVFSEDGQTGYIATIGNDGTAEEIAPNIYPIYWKTTDAGENWEGPFFVQLDGPNGLGGIVNHHLTDEAIAELFEAPVPSREEISYTTAFDMNCIVDNNGNLHMAVVIGPTGEDAFTIVTARGYIAALDIFTTDGGTSWYAEEMGRIENFRGSFGDLSSDNRIQITSNYDGDKIFISWLDTDLGPDQEDNDQPNIFIRGFEPATYMKTNYNGNDEPTNVTKFSEAYWAAFFFAAPKWCLENDGVYSIPMVYEGMTPAAPEDPVQFKYITNFSFSDADFTVQAIGEPVVSTNNINSVSQNFPNPFNNETYVTVSLNEGSNLSLEVYTLTGQMVSAKDYSYMTKGSHTLSISGANLTSGVYFYTVTAGENKVTHKMIVE